MTPGPGRHLPLPRGIRGRRSLPGQDARGNTARRQDLGITAAHAPGTSFLTLRTQTHASTLCFCIPHACSRGTPASHTGSHTYTRTPPQARVDRTPTHTWHFWIAHSTHVHPGPLDTSGLHTGTHAHTQMHTHPWHVWVAHAPRCAHTPGTSGSHTHTLAHLDCTRTLTLTLPVPRTAAAEEPEPEGADLARLVELLLQPGHRHAAPGGRAHTPADTHTRTDTPPRRTLRPAPLPLPRSRKWAGRGGIPPRPAPPLPTGGARPGRHHRDARESAALPVVLQSGARRLERRQAGHCPPAEAPGSAGRAGAGAGTWLQSRVSPSWGA